MDKIDWDTIEWRFDEMSFRDTAKALLRINPEPWKDYSEEQLVDHMKFLLRYQCRLDDKVIASLGTGGFYVHASLCLYPSGNYIWGNATIMPFTVNRYLDALEKKEKESA
jgi:hypothetical protein